MSKLEAKIEAELVKRARAFGFLTFKLDQIPGARNNPDQLLISTITRECVFVEVKRVDLEPRPAQLAKHRHLRDKGQHVEILDNVDDIQAILEMYIK